MDLFVKKGFVSQEEVDQVKAEAEASQTNAISQSSLSKWKVGDGIVQMEFYGDIRLRYEDRYAKDPEGDRIDLQRERYSVRLGLRGTLLDDFYYGFRLETGSNPRSTWLTMGNSSSSTFQGPDSRPRQPSPLARHIWAGDRALGWISRWARCPIRSTPRRWSGLERWNRKASPNILNIPSARRISLPLSASLFIRTFNPNTASGDCLGNGLEGQNVPNILPDRLGRRPDLSHHGQTFRQGRSHDL